MKDINIIIKALLEKQSKKHILNEIKQIQNTINKTPLKLKLSVDNSQLQQLSSNLQRLNSSLNQSLDIGNIQSSGLNKVSEKIVKIGNRTEYASKRIKEWTGNLGQTIKQVDTLDNKTQEVVKTITTSTTNYKQQRLESEKITDQINKQKLAQKDMLTTIKGFRGKNISFIQEDELKRLNNLETTVKNLDPTSKNFAKSMREVKSQFKAINTDVGIYRKQIQDASKYTNIFGQSLLEAGKKFFSWILIASAIMTPIRLFRDGLTALKEIDNQLTQLRKVTGETMSTMNDFAKIGNQIAIKMGVATSKVIEATVAFSRLGYSIQKASKLAEESTLLSIVGNMDIEKAQTSLVSIVKAFGIEVDKQGKNVRKVIDMVNNVGNNFAISQEDIAEILRRSSSAMKEAGDSIEETIALGTGGQEIVQDAEKIGTALNVRGLIA